MTGKDKIQVMWGLFGRNYGHTCRECTNLEKVNLGSKCVYKCVCYGKSSSEATDFPVKNYACGLFNKTGVKDVYKTIAHSRKKEVVEQEECLFEVEE